MKFPVIKKKGNFDNCLLRKHPGEVQAAVRGLGRTCLNAAGNG